MDTNWFEDKKSNDSDNCFKQNDSLA